MAEHESADERVAVELATLLPRLPRTKITPQTITQTIIDRWYGYEAEYRQTIAELRAELAAANERAERRDAIQTEAIRAAKGLARCWQQLAEEAQARLAELGEAETEFGHRVYGPDYVSDGVAQTDRQFAEWAVQHLNTEVLPPDLRARLVVHEVLRHETEWRDAE